MDEIDILHFRWRSSIIMGSKVARDPYMKSKGTQGSLIIEQVPHVSGQAGHLGHKTGKMKTLSSELIKLVLCCIN